MTAGPPAGAAGRVRWSLAQRLQQHLLAVVALLWLLSVAVAMLAVRHEMNAVLDGALLSLARQMPLDDSGTATAPAGPAMLPREREDDVLHVLVRDAQGHTLRVSGLPSDVPWPLNLTEGMSTVSDWRIATRRTPDGAVLVQVGESLHERHGALAESSLAMVLPLLALLPLAAFAIHLLLRRVFTGVRAAGDHWRARPEGDPSPLQALDLPTEFDPLIGSIDTLVGRLQGLVRAERAFAASSAHELRTPIAAARAQAQRLMAELPDAQARGHAVALVRSLDRISNTTTKLLQLARVESGIGFLKESMDLRQLATLVLDEFRHPASTADRLRVQLPEQPVMVHGDLDALGIAMRNLIENALRHAPAAQVRVRIEAPGRLIVSDDGPGVPAGALPSLLKPFSRGSTQVEGTGLGLAIVSRIAEQQRATLTLESPPPGEAQGFRATLSLLHAAEPPSA
jgi:two-component system OmpR family sensor kinase